MHKIRKQVAAAYILVPLFVMSGCSGGAPVYVTGLETDALQATGMSGKSPEETSLEKTETEEPKAEGAKAAELAEVSGQNSYSGDAQKGAGYVYVCGAVASPGVYPVTENMRVFEAIALAGGFSPEADEQWLNQAQTVTDGQRLYVYTVEETRQMKEEGAAAQEGEAAAQNPGQTDAENASCNQLSTAEDGRININTADQETLMMLPGIGEVKAEAIIQYRTEHGSFASIEEIQNISGIKNAVFSKIRDLITV